MEDIKNKIWCVLRPNLQNGNIIDIGIMGTGFFISENKFITAYHLLNEKCFEANNQYNNDYIILKNLSGNEIKIKSSHDITYSPEKDITSITLKEKFDYFDLAFESEESENIINLGFPSNFINHLIDKIGSLHKVVVQKGKILKNIGNFSSKSNNVNIDGKKIIVTSYSSIVGFSGGPLINNLGKVIGMMSMVIPSGNGIFSNKAIAISAKEF